MKGLVFAAGIGSRLRPWTLSHPKALVPVGGEPMLGRVIDKLSGIGIETIIVNVHHFAQQVKDFLSRREWGAEIIVSDESDQLLDTGGGLRRVLPWLGEEPVLIHNADIFTDVPLREMINAHNMRAADATLLTDPRQTARRFVINDDRHICGWVNTANGQTKPEGFTLTSAGSLRAFDGVHIVSPTLYPILADYAPEDKPFSITDFYLDVCSHHAITGYDRPSDAVWFDVGKPETLKQAQEYALTHTI